LSIAGNPGLSVGAEGIPKAFADAREALESTLTFTERNVEVGETRRVHGVRRERVTGLSDP
jgi:hypothetical protein